MLKKFVLGGMVVVAALLGNACGDDGSSDSPAGPADGEVTLSSSSDDVVLGNSSSSSVTESPSTSSGQVPQSAESDGSSSSEKAVDGSSSSDGKTSSSSGKVESSSSEKAKSSSSDTQSEVKQSSSSEKTGKSSSSTDDASSSSVKSESSSSDENSQSSSSSSTDARSSSSETESSSSSSEDSEPVERSSSSSLGDVNCSALLEGKTGWSWDVPKECRFNPDIDYGTMTDERDGNVYRTVKIGDQVWMAENLNYADSSKTPSLLKRSRCYKNVAKNCDVAGRLYTWAAAMDSVKTGCGYRSTCDLASANSTGSSTGSATLVQGICPTGWHLPSQTEWMALFTAVGGQSTAGKVLKSQSGWNNNGNGTDAFGFSALPAGDRLSDGYFYDVGARTYFWSSSEVNSSDAYIMLLYHNLKDAYLYNYDKKLVFSVRCVKD